MSLLLGAVPDRLLPVRLLPARNKPPSHLYTLRRSGGLELPFSAFCWATNLNSYTRLFGSKQCCGVKNNLIIKGTSWTPLVTFVYHLQPSKKWKSLSNQCIHTVLWVGAYGLSVDLFRRSMRCSHLDQSSAPELGCASTLPYPLKSTEAHLCW